MMVFNWQKYISSCFFKIYMFYFPFYYFLPWAFAMFFELMNLSLWEKVICTWPEINKGERSHLNKKIQNQPFICMLRNPDPGSYLAVAIWVLLYPAVLQDYELQVASYSSGLETLLNIPIKKCVVQSPAVLILQEVSFFPPSSVFWIRLFICVSHCESSSYIIISTAIGSVY